MKVQKYIMQTRMHGTPTGRPDYLIIFPPTLQTITIAPTMSI